MAEEIVNPKCYFKNEMAVDLEFSRSVRRFQTNLETIISKYDRPFKDDDVLDLTDYKVVENNGKLEKHNAKHFGSTRLRVTKRREQFNDSDYCTGSNETDNSIWTIAGGNDTMDGDPNLIRYRATDNSANVTALEELRGDVLLEEDEPSDAETLSDQSSSYDSQEDDSQPETDKQQTLKPATSLPKSDFYDADVDTDGFTSSKMSIVSSPTPKCKDLMDKLFKNSRLVVAEEMIKPDVKQRTRTLQHQTNRMDFKAPVRKQQVSHNVSSKHVSYNIDTSPSNSSEDEIITLPVPTKPKLDKTYTIKRITPTTLEGIKTKGVHNEQQIFKSPGKFLKRKTGVLKDRSEIQNSSLLHGNDTFETSGVPTFNPICNSTRCVVDVTNSTNHPVNRSTSKSLSKKPIFAADLPEQHLGAECISSESTSSVQFYPEKNCISNAPRPKTCSKSVEEMECSLQEYPNHCYSKEHPGSREHRQNNTPDLSELSSRYSNSFNDQSCLSKRAQVGSPGTRPTDRCPQKDEERGKHLQSVSCQHFGPSRLQPPECEIPLHRNEKSSVRDQEVYVSEASIIHPHHHHVRNVDITRSDQSFDDLQSSELRQSYQEHVKRPTPIKWGKQEQNHSSVDYSPGFRNSEHTRPRNSEHTHPRNSEPIHPGQHTARNESLSKERVSSVDYSPGFRHSEHTHLRNSEHLHPRNSEHTRPAQHTARNESMSKERVSSVGYSLSPGCRPSSNFYLEELQTRGEATPGRGPLVDSVQSPFLRYSHSTDVEDNKARNDPTPGLCHPSGGNVKSPSSDHHRGQCDHLVEKLSSQPIRHSDRPYPDHYTGPEAMCTQGEPSAKSFKEHKCCNQPYTEHFPNHDSPGVKTNEYKISEFCDRYENHTPSSDHRGNIELSQNCDHKHNQHHFKMEATKRPAFANLESFLLEYFTHRIPNKNQRISVNDFRQEPNATPSPVQTYEEGGYFTGHSTQGIQNSHPNTDKLYSQSPRHSNGNIGIRCMEKDMVCPQQAMDCVPKYRGTCKDRLQGRNALGLKSELCSRSDGHISRSACSGIHQHCADTVTATNQEMGPFDYHEENSFPNNARDICEDWRTDKLEQRQSNYSYARRQQSQNTPWTSGKLRNSGMAFYNSPNTNSRIMHWLDGTSYSSLSKRPFPLQSMPAKLQTTCENGFSSRPSPTLSFKKSKTYLPSKPLPSPHQFREGVVTASRSEHTQACSSAQNHRRLEHSNSHSFQRNNTSYPIESTGDNDDDPLKSCKFQGHCQQVKVGTDRTVENKENDNIHVDKYQNGDLCTDQAEKQRYEPDFTDPYEVEPSTMFTDNSNHSTNQTPDRRYKAHIDGSTAHKKIPSDYKVSPKSPNMSSGRSFQPHIASSIPRQISGNPKTATYSSPSISTRMEEMKLGTPTSYLSNDVTPRKLNPNTDKVNTVTPDKIRPSVQELCDVNQGIRSRDRATSTPRRRRLHTNTTLNISAIRPVNSAFNQRKIACQKYSSLSVPVRQKLDESLVKVRQREKDSDSASLLPADGICIINPPDKSFDFKKLGQTSLNRGKHVVNTKKRTSKRMYRSSAEKKDLRKITTENLSSQPCPRCNANQNNCSCIYELISDENSDNDLCEPLPLTPSDHNNSSKKANKDTPRNEFEARVKSLRSRTKPYVPARKSLVDAFKVIISSDSEPTYKDCSPRKTKSPLTKRIKPVCLESPDTVPMPAFKKRRMDNSFDKPDSSINSSLYCEGPGKCQKTFCFSCITSD